MKRVGIASSSNSNSYNSFAYDNDNDNKKKNGISTYTVMFMSIILFMLLSGTYYISNKSSILSASSSLASPSLSIPAINRASGDSSKEQLQQQLLRQQQQIKKQQLQDEQVSLKLQEQSIVQQQQLQQQLLQHQQDTEGRQHMIALLDVNIKDKLSEIKSMKSKGIVLETDPDAAVKIDAVQKLIRTYMKDKYGDEPYTLEMLLTFPDSMMEQGKSQRKHETVYVELAPLAYVPYCVYYFMNIIEKMDHGNFHRNAGHVLQAMMNANADGWDSFKGGLAYQEYHPSYPHVKYTLGYAGRPGGPSFYISTVDNSLNHGPGSQGSKTEADGIIGKVINVDSQAVVEIMRKQPDAGNSGFINNPSSYIRIDSIKLVKQ